MRAYLSTLWRQLDIKMSDSMLANCELMRRNKNWSAGQKKKNISETQPNFPGVFKLNRGRRKENSRATK